MPEAEALETQRISAPRYKRVSRQLEGLILKLAEAGKTQMEIAAIAQVSQSTVSRTIDELTDTRVVAKAILHNRAKFLAERVIKNADVDQALEVLDRIDVAPKRRDEPSASQVMVIVQQGSSIPGITLQTQSSASLSPVPRNDLPVISTD
jgi:DNA-binding transcriptional regulator LsrR (DeoR family)